MYSTIDLQKLVLMLDYLGITPGGGAPAHSVVLGGGANAAPGPVGTLFGSNGATSDPSFQTFAGLRISVVCDSISALAALDSSVYTHAFVTGYYAPHDGGGGAYQLDPLDTTSAGDGGSIIVASDGGRWKLSIVQEITVKQFGATDGGDLKTALTAAVAYLVKVGGGKVRIPASASVWKLSGTIAVNASDIRIEGDGHGESHDVGTGNVAATQIQWTGAANGDMFQFQPTSTATRGIKGNGLSGVYLAANGAGRGVLLRSTCDGVYDFSGAEFTIAMLDMNCLTTLSEAADTQRNEISIRGRQVAGAGGAILLCDGSPVANCSFNLFKIVKGVYANISAAIHLLSTDNNMFITTHLVRGGGTGIGVLLDATTSSSVPAASNMFINLSPGAGGVYAAGTERGTYPSIYNSILFYDKGNGPPDPVSGTNAILYWSSNYQGAIGRRKDTLTSSQNWYVDSAGRFHVFGVTGSIGASSTGSFTLPGGITVTAGIQSILLTPRSNSVSKYSAQWTGTQVNVSNGDATTATDFWYEVIGF
jgi:hypothetical protein